MQPNEKLMTEILRNSLDKTKADVELSPEELTALCKESRFQAVTAMVYFALPKTSESKNSDFGVLAMRSVAHNVNIVHAHLLVGKKMDEDGIPYCFIKGCASAYYYPVPDYRAMGDIDLLVKREDMPRVDAALKEMGYKLNEAIYGHNHHVSYTKGELHIEVHYSIGDKTENGFSLESLTDEIIRTTQKAEFDGKYINIPSPYYHAVIMLFHVYRHLLGRGIGLRHLCDFAVFLRHPDFIAVEDELCRSAKEWGVYNLYRALSQTSAKYLGVNYRESFGKRDDSLAENLISSLFQTGNFGVKNLGGMQQFLVNKSFSKGSFLKNFITSVTCTVHCRWPKTEGNKALFVLRLLSLPFVYLAEFVTGKRKMPNLKNDIGGAKAQNRLLEQLADDK